VRGERFPQFYPPLQWIKSEMVNLPASPLRSAPRSHCRCRRAAPSCECPSRPPARPVQQGFPAAQKLSAEREAAIPKTRFRPAQAIQIDPTRPARMSAPSRHVALLTAANASAFASPMLRKKSLGGKLDGTYPKIRVTPSTPVTSSHPASPPSMMASWDPLIFLPMNSSGCGSRAMMLC